MPLAGSGLCDDSTGVCVRLPWRVYVGCYVEGEGDPDNDEHHDRWLWLHSDIDLRHRNIPLRTFSGSCRIWGM